MSQSVLGNDGQQQQIDRHGYEIWICAKQYVTHTHTASSSCHVCVTMSPQISNQHACTTRGEVCLIDGCMKSPLLCCVFMCVCLRARKREVGVGAAAVAWGEVLPWFSLEFRCFWKPERGKLNLRSLRVSAPWEFSAHISLPPALMVLRVALFSKLWIAKVFFTF